jgi:4-amino-4-deoxy-L-arabinose transferase-like glycosyltransferase
MSQTRRFDAYLVVAVLLSLFAVAPLLAPGYFWGAHDARHSVYFLTQFDRVIQDGILYPRWAPDFNFGDGYPFFNIYSPGVFYLGEALHLLGLDFVDSIKGVFALSFVLSALAMYLYARRVLGSRAAALISAVVYVYVPYHLADVFLRAALADSFCFVFFPLALLGFHDLMERPSPRALALAGAALAGLIFSHYALALLFIPFLSLYILVLWALRQRTLRSLFWAAGAGIYGVLLSAVLILPVALEYRFVRTDQWAGGYYSYKDHFVYFFQFFAPTWGYGPGSVPGPNDTLPFQLGVVALTLSLLAVVALVLLRRARQTHSATPLLVFYVLATLGLMLLMLNMAAPLWEVLHLAAFAQFPWRLLALTTLTMSVLSGVVVMVDEQRQGSAPLPLLAALLAVVVLGSYAYLQPQLIDPPQGPVSQAGLMRFQQASGELTGMTAWATRERPPSWSPLADVYVAGGMVTDKVVRSELPAGVQATTTVHTTAREEVQISATQAFTLSFYTPYYPGWRATLDGKPVTITPAGDLGHMSIAVPAGEHMLVLWFGDTPPRTIGTILSLLACAGGLVMVRRR